MEHEFIYYVHDSSETSADSFTVVANDTGLRKQSSAQTVYIQVTAVNDEPPVIAANRLLRVSLHCCSIFKLWTFFTSRSRTQAYCQTVFVWAVFHVDVAGSLHEANYVCYVGGEGPGGPAAQSRHWHTLWRCLGLVGKSVTVSGRCIFKQMLARLQWVRLKQCCSSELTTELLFCLVWAECEELLRLL